MRESLSMLTIKDGSPTHLWQCLGKWFTFSKGFRWTLVFLFGDFTKITLRFSSPTVCPDATSVKWGLVTRLRRGVCCPRGWLSEWLSTSCHVSFGPNEISTSASLHIKLFDILLEQNVMRPTNICEECSSSWALLAFVNNVKALPLQRGHTQSMSLKIILSTWISSACSVELIIWFHGNV